MTTHGNRVVDDRALLLARIDELTATVAALLRAMAQTRWGQDLQAEAPPTEATIVEFLNGVETDLAYLRGLADAHHHMAIATQASLETTQEELNAARDELTGMVERLASVDAACALWAEECGRLRESRDTLVEEVLALQGGRWMRLGRALGVGRQMSRR